MSTVPARTDRAAAGRRLAGILVRIVVSTGCFGLFLWKVGLRALGSALTGLPLGHIALPCLVLFSLPAANALRWFILVRGHGGDTSFSYRLALRLSFVGLFFNIVLPTGTGGDVVKILYATRGRERKLVIGSSVVVDRFLGAVSVLTMGIVALLLSGVGDRRVTLIMAGLLGAVLLLALAFSHRSTARFLAGWLRHVLPPAAAGRLRSLYDAFSVFFSDRGVLLAALGVSFGLQVVSIVAQHNIAGTLAAGQGPPLRFFFVAIPLIWASCLVPSLGGLGVREFTYSAFFSPLMGTEAAAALALVNLAVVVCHSAAGALVFLMMRSPGQRAAHSTPSTSR